MSRFRVDIVGHSLAIVAVGASRRRGRCAANTTGAARLTVVDCVGVGDTGPQVETVRTHEVLTVVAVVRSAVFAAA